MGLRENIRQLTDIEQIHDFADFVLSNVTEGKLPDYETLNLMQVPNLVPNIFVHDYRNGLDEGFFIKFSGTKLDEHYGQVVQGNYFQDTYSGDDAETKYFPLHFEAIERKKPFFATRTVNYQEGLENEKFRLSTAIYFPCSTDQISVNYAIGMVLFEFVPQAAEPIYMIIGD